ncbi:putative RING-H2 finger protein ATL21A [Cornus florida]|uniref:putative RING-H2 finger protein ATL21A n=1 Tax=Cornus florida TaxID=4283 RepID=UPI0028A07D51|nr:putative RING-H2 finger protein ATL21A [Cornus florida]
MKTYQLQELFGGVFNSRKSYLKKKKKKRFFSSLNQMDTFLSFFFFSSFFTHTALCIHNCSPSSCDDSELPLVQFPFRLLGRQPSRCGYPGFNLSCNNQNKTVLDLPSSSGEFIVKSINYASQSIHISDPNGCLPKRMQSFSLSDSPFSAYPTNFMFLNCTLSDWHKYLMSRRSVLVPCLSSPNYRVVAMDASSVGGLPPGRKWRVGFYGYYWSTMDGVGTAAIELNWDVPKCKACVVRGGTCGFKSNTGLKIGCSGRLSFGLPRSAKYGLILGVGIPGLLTFIGLACYIGGRTGTHSHRGPLPSERSTITTAPGSAGIATATGLDGPTIESYPTTVLGESRRLPNPQDGTCPICLSEYQPKDTLRTIPDCDHYFHANCIDEWLRMNSTCPLCRNSLDEPSGV